AAQRDDDDLGNEVARLHPGDLVRSRGQASPDVLQGGRDDLDVQERDEEPDAHRAEGEGLGTRGELVRRAPGAHRTTSELMRTVTERPGRSTPSTDASASSSMRTGTRWTILVKLPVAFSGGSTLN